MIARVQIIDNGIPKGTYDVNPSRAYDYVTYTKYVFEFEYTQANSELCRMKIENKENYK